MPRLPDAVRNPFSSSVTGDPWESGNTDSVDVPEIHRDVFETCLRAIAAVRTNQSSSGVLIHGEAGSGKTHLLKRLRTHCLKTADDLEPWRIEQVFVAVRLQVDAGMLWRYLRQRLVDDLMKLAGAGRSQLEHAVMLRAAGLSGSDGDLYLWWDYILKEPPDVLDVLLDGVAEHAELDYSFLAVIRNLIRRRQRTTARNWLRGDSLPEAALNQLGVGPGDVDADPETSAQEFVLALCRLIGPGIPIVVCLDQVETLLRHHDDTASLASLGRLVSTLQNGTSNILTVACMQTGFLSQLRDAFGTSDWQRLTESGDDRMSPLNVREATQIVRSRLSAVPEIAALRPRNADPVWPLEPAEIAAIVGDGCTPRTLISQCDRLLRQPPSTPVPAGPALSREQVSANLARELDQRLDVAEEPEDSSVDTIVGHAVPWLLETVGGDESWQVRRESDLRDVDFVAVRADGEARVGLSLLNERNMTRLAARLRRLRSQTDTLQKLVMIRDARAPITATARATRSYLSELEQNDALLWRPSAELLATLNVIRGLLAESQSGDLSCDGNTIGPATLQEWLKRELRGSLSSVREAAEDLLRPTAPGGFDFEPDADWLTSLAEFLNERHVVSLDEAAEHCGCDRSQLVDLLQDHPQLFGLLRGEPRVVFRAVSGGRA